MANVQDLKAEKATKTLRLFTILLLVAGVAALAMSFYDLVSGAKLLTLFNAEKTVEASNFGGQTVAFVLLVIAGVLLVAGTVLHLVKGNYRMFQGFCIAAIIFAVFPLIFFAVNIGKHLFALIYTLVILAIIVLAIIAMKARWQVYIKEMTGEVKKLTWLNMKELVKATTVVLVFVLAFALLIFVLDFLFNLPIKALLSDNATPVPAATTEPSAAPTAEPEATVEPEEGTTEEGTTEEGTTEEGTTEEAAPVDTAEPEEGEGTENNG